MKINRTDDFYSFDKQLTNEIIINKSRYDLQISQIILLWDKTLLNLRCNVLDKDKQEILRECQNKWNDALKLVKETDIAIRLEINKLLFYFSKMVDYQWNEKELMIPIPYTDSEWGIVFENKIGHVPISLHVSLFKLIRLFAILNDNIFAIMEILQKLRVKICDEKSLLTTESVIQDMIYKNSERDHSFVKHCMLDIKEDFKQNISNVLEQIEKQNNKEIHKPISQKRCAELIVEELENEFPNIKEPSIKRMLSDWDTGKRTPVKSYLFFKNNAEESLFRTWVKMYFAVHYRNEHRGKYIRRTTTHNPNAFDQYSFSQYEQENRHIDEDETEDDLDEYLDSMTGDSYIDNEIDMNDPEEGETDY